jgi:hypothetical protein
MKMRVRYFNQIGGAHTEPGYVRVNPVTREHEWDWYGGLGTWDPSREWAQDEEVCEHCGATIVDGNGWPGSQKRQQLLDHGERATIVDGNGWPGSRFHRRRLRASLRYNR